MNSYFFTVAGSLLFPSCATVSLLGSLAMLFAWLIPSFAMSSGDSAVIQAVTCQEDKQNHYFLKTLFFLSHFYEHMLMVPKQWVSCDIFMCSSSALWSYCALIPLSCPLFSPTGSSVPSSTSVSFFCLNLHSTWGFKPFWVWLLSLSVRSSRFHPFSCKGRDLVFPYSWIKRHRVNITFFIVAIHGLMATYGLAVVGTAALTVDVRGFLLFWLDLFVYVPECYSWVMC